jgi:DnaJ-domain-containing protein 1
VSDPGHLEAVVAALLLDGEVYAEHALLGALRERQVAGFEGRPADDLGLFRQHFLLFHLLYRLRDRWRAEASADLEIGPLCIARLAYRPGEAALAADDPLRAYYLDLTQLAATGAEEVAALLAGVDRRLRADSKREAALTVLGLDASADFAATKAHYRRLAMRHHPDRGGDPQRLQAINDAMAVLAKWHGR